jgi:hypothetical protein
MGTFEEPALARYHPDGALDSSFGTGGIVVTPLPGVERANSVTLQGDGKIVIVGYTDPNGGDFLVARYDGDPPLLAAGPQTLAPSSGRLTEEALRPIGVAARARWQAAGIDVTALDGIGLRITDLGGALLGMTDGRTVWLDDNAAGWGWFVDPTPDDDSEFLLPGDQGEQGRMDLLTTVLHELGHALGLPDLDPVTDADDLLAATLPPGTRRLPEPGVGGDQPTWEPARTTTRTTRHRLASTRVARIPIDTNGFALAIAIDQDRVRKHRR